MTPDQAIAILDRMLSTQGEDVVLLRVDDDNGVVAQVACRARVDRTKSDNAPAGVAPAGFSLILSPTQLRDGGWPDGDPANIVPVENAGDKVALDGRDERRTVVWVDAKKINNQIVRIDMRISG